MKKAVGLTLGNQQVQHARAVGDEGEGDLRAPRCSVRAKVATEFLSPRGHWSGLPTSSKALTEWKRKGLRSAPCHPWIA